MTVALSLSECNHFEGVGEGGGLIMDVVVRPRLRHSQGQQGKYKVIACEVWVHLAEELQHQCW